MPVERLKSTPATCVVGVPDFPVADPETGVSPGTKICNLLIAPASTLINEDVLGLKLNPLAVPLATIIQPGVRFFVLSETVCVKTPLLMGAPLMMGLLT